jgi:hypothetical protein
MVTFISHTLRGAVEGTEPAVVALFHVQNRSFRTPAARIQAQEQFIGVGPGTFRFKNILMFNYHLMTSTSR